MSDLKCLDNLTDDEITGIAETFACAFLNEEGMVSKCLTYEEACTYFFIVLKAYAKNRSLYTIGENDKAYLVMHRKTKALPWYRELVLFFTFLGRLPFSCMQKMILSQRDWIDYTVQYAAEKDYLNIAYIAIHPAFQHQGLFRKLMEEAFAYAERNHLFCALDTDSEAKAKKYCHLGMSIEKDAVLESGIHMYTLRYQPFDQ